MVKSGVKGYKGLCAFKQPFGVNELPPISRFFFGGAYFGGVHAPFNLLLCLYRGSACTCLSTPQNTPQSGGSAAVSFNQPGLTKPQLIP